MSLPNVEWRYVGREVVGTGTIYPNTILDSIYNLASKTGYADGSVRTTGTGSAGIWDRYQTGGGTTEAIYVTPPSGNQKIIIAGSTGTPSPSPTMNTSIGVGSGYAVNKLFVNLTKNPGNFDSWNAANPFTSGNAFGYVPFLGSRSSSTVGISGFTTLYSYLFESKESIAVFLVDLSSSDSTSYSNGFIAGAVVDPQSSNLYDAESDGRIYGILSTGHANSATAANSAWDSPVNLWSTNWHNDADSFSFLYGYRTDLCSGRGGIFVPDSSGIKPIVISHGLANHVGTAIGSCFVTASGKYVKLPILMKSAIAGDNIIFGLLRNISYCQRGIMAQKQIDGANTIGHLVACSNRSTTTAEAVLLEY